jgi:CubicO group peptidase (beta-lactamase class C family)
MDFKKWLYPPLAVCCLAALIQRLFAKDALPDPHSEQTSFDAIESYLEGQMRRLKIPGCALAIVDGDRIVHQRGYGLARPGGEAPTPQTPFVLGSTTKSITALAIMQLVEADKVELDAPVRRYLPWFRVADSDASVQMTVRHLLNQTSGLPGIPGMVNLSNLDCDPDAAERQARALSTLKLSNPVGAKFEYSNLNYNLLGLIIEAACGETYQDYIQRHIFAPLEMSRSYSLLAEAKANGLAVGHRYWFAQPIPEYDLPLPRGSMASGQLISCAEDMAQYLIAHLNGGGYKGKQLLSSAGMDELHRGVAEQRLMGKLIASYGMGWFATTVDQVEVVSHGGNVPDFSSYIAILPEQKKGVVLLLNSDHYGLPVILPEVGDGLAALLAGLQPPPIQLGFIPWLMRALPLIPLLQIVGVFNTLSMIRRWNQAGSPRPRGKRLWLQHILLPLIPNMSLAALRAALHSNGLIRYLRLYNPDFAWIIDICGRFANIWAYQRTWLILKTLRKNPQE